MIYLWGFLVFSMLLLVFTLLRKQGYRFSRFLAFECLLGLIFLNGPEWFDNPGSLRQLASWLLLFGSIFLAVMGFYILKKAGQPQGDFEETSQLVTIGVYRFIRHPLYTSLLLFGIGGFLKQPNWMGVGILLVLMVSLYLTAVIEERENLTRFGEPYQLYMEQTKRFIPFVY